MKDPQQNSTVSIVLPTLGDLERLRVSIPPLVRAIESRGFDPDELLIVDDSGEERSASAVPEVLGSLNASRKGSVHVLGGKERLGFAGAVKLGAETARGALMFVVQDDVEVTPGALEALIDVMRPEDVFAAGPRIVRSIDGGVAGDESRGGSFQGGGGQGDGRHRDAPSPVQVLDLVDDRLEVREVAGRTGGPPIERAPFVPATAAMIRREVFLEFGGFDPLLAPFTWEDVDLGVCARRRGMRVLRTSEAVVVHHTDLPSIWTQSVDADLAAAVVERNRLLLRWKHLATRTEATEHLVALWRQVIEAGLAGDRDTLERACLAFAKLGEVTASRQKMAGVQTELADVLAGR